MKHDALAAPALTLQNKLDLIAHEREVLALLRELARQGLREGDLLQRLDDGSSGRLEIDHERSPPCAMVATARGGREPYLHDRWRRR